MTVSPDIVGVIVTALVGLIGAIFVFITGKDVAKKEEKLKAVEEHNEAVRVVNEVKQEVDAEISTASDDHLVTVAHRWLRPSASDSKPH